MITNLIALAGCLLTVLVIRKVNKLMSAVSDYLAQQAQFNTDLLTAVDSFATPLAGLTEDIATLNQTIADLKLGGDTAENVAAIEALKTQGANLVSRAQAAAAAYAALDALTPPTVPTQPPAVSPPLN